jgi:hypothetical protein
MTGSGGVVGHTSSSACDQPQVSPGNTSVGQHRRRPQEPLKAALLRTMFDPDLENPGSSHSVVPAVEPVRPRASRAHPRRVGRSGSGCRSGWTAGAPTRPASCWPRCPACRRRPRPGWPAGSPRRSGRRLTPGSGISSRRHWPRWPPAGRGPVRAGDDRASASRRPAGRRLATVSVAARRREAAADSE